MLAAQAGEKPDGQGSGVGPGLVGMKGHLLDGAGQIERGIEIEFVMLGAIVPRHAPRVTALVELAAAERNGESLHRARRSFGGVVQDGRGIEAAAGPQAERHIGGEVFANGGAQQAVELLGRVFERLPRLGIETQPPIGRRAHAPVFPLQPGGRAEAFSIPCTIVSGPGT